MQSNKWLATILGICLVTFQVTATPSATQETTIQFPTEMLTPLLAAELAIHREDFNLAYQLYSKIARESKDPGIAKRATQLALTAANPTLALEFALLWAEQAPEDQEAQLITSVLLTLDSQLSKAATHLGILLKQDPHNIELFSTYYQQFEGTEKLLAKKVFEHLHTTFPNNPLLNILLADLAYSEGQFSRAKDFLTPVLKLKTHPIEADILHVYMLREQNQLSNALQFMRDRLKATPEAVILRREYFSLLLETEQTKAASKQLALLLKEKNIEATTLVELGRQAMEMAWYQEATLAFKRAALSQEHTDIAGYFLGRVSELEGNFTTAISYFTKVENGPFHTVAHIRAALLLTELKEYDEAILVLNNTYPQDEMEQKQLYLTASEVLFAARRFQDGLLLSQEGLKLFPQDPDLLYAHSIHAESLKDFSLAEADLLKILEHQPNHVDALNALGFLLTNHSTRYTEAFSYLEKAYQLDPENPIVMDSIGWWYFRKGELQESLKWLKTAFARYADGEIAAHLGEVLWHHGEHNHALEVWHTALSQAPHHPILLETMQRVRNQKTSISDNHE